MNDMMLTTTDNPWNPNTHFKEWYAWDTAKGYGTCEYLARIARVSSELPDPVNDAIIDDAIDEIVKRDLIALVTDGEVHYRRISPSDIPPLIK